jgi:hypothetical protein
VKSSAFSLIHFRRTLPLALLLGGLACGGNDSPPALTPSPAPSPTPRPTYTPTAGVPTDGLVAEWIFNGGADDSSGYAHHGTIVGAVPAPDRSGQEGAAFGFHRTYIFGSADGLPRRARTLSLWFYARTLDRPVLFGYGGGACGTSWWLGLNNGNGAEGTIQLDGHCVEHRLLYAYGAPLVNAWHHLAVSTAPQGTRMYLDGSLVASSSMFVNDTVVAGKRFAIGVAVGPDGMAPYEDANVSYFDGVLDDLRLYDRALDDSEILDLFHEGD